MSVASVSSVKPQNPKAGLSPAMAFLGKRLFTTKKYEFARATLSTPGKIIGSTLALAGAGLALKTLYDYVMDIADSTWNKIAYLGSSAVCGALSLASFISSNVSENYKISTPEERIKDPIFKEEVFKSVTSSVSQRLKTPLEINQDILGERFESFDSFINFLGCADKSKVIELPYYSLRVKFVSNTKFNIEPIDDNQYIFTDNRSRHKYTLRCQFDLYSFEDQDPLKASFDVYILAKKFNDTGDFKEVSGGGPYSVSVPVLDNWLELNFSTSLDESNSGVLNMRPAKRA